MYTLRNALFGTLAAALLMLVPGARQLSAQMASRDRGVAVMNESPNVVQVFAFNKDEDQRILLGWVGNGEFEYFKVPEKATSSDGGYRVAVQQVTPLPQIGVEATQNPLLTTPMLSPAPDQTIRVVVDEDMELSTATLR